MTQSNSPRWTHIAIVTVASALVVGAGAAGRFLQNVEALREMPEWRRAQLQANLDRFDALPAEERSRLRELDSKWQSLPAVEQTRLLSVMRQYQGWFNGLGPSARKGLESKTDAQRLAQITAQTGKILSRPLTRNGFDWLQFSHLAPKSIRVSVVELTLWFAMDVDDRRKLLQIANGHRQSIEFERKVRNTPRLATMWQEQRQLLGLAGEEPRDQPPRRVERLKAAALKAERTAEQHYLRSARRDPVSEESLKRFEQQMPSWIRAEIDAMPPESAIRRLRFLYRQVFPMPHEIAEEPRVFLPISRPADAPKGAEPPARKLGRGFEL
jgi:hypothetical protein